MTIQINKASAIKAYNEAPKDLKKVLENLFGKEHLSDKITDRIKTFDDVLAAVKLSKELEKLLSYSGDCPRMKAAAKQAKVELICEVLNEGWTPDWTDSNQPKYVPYFEYKSGVGFSYYVCVFWYTDTHVRSRLCYKSRELAEYAGKQFQSIYNDYLNL